MTFTHKARGIAGAFFCFSVLGATAGYGQAVIACQQPVSSAVWAGGSEAAADISVAADALSLDISVPEGDSAVTQFTLSQPMMVRVEAVATNENGDPVLEVLDTNGIRVGYNDDGGDNLNSLAEIQLAPGSYCARIRDYGAAAMEAQVRIGRLEHDALASSTPVPPARGDSSLTGICQLGTTTARWVGGAQENSEIQMAGGSLDADVNVSSGGSEVIVFSVGQQMLVRVEAVAQLIGDPVLEIFDESGMSVDYNDDANQSLNSMVETSLAPGTYCAQVRGFGSSSFNGTVRVADLSAPLLGSNAGGTPGDVPPQFNQGGACALGISSSRWVAGSQSASDISFASGPLNGVVSVPEGGADVLQFEVSQHTLTRIEAVAQISGDPVLELYDEFGNLVGSNDDGGNGLNSLLEISLSSGSYCAYVRGFGRSSLTADVRIGLMGHASLEGSGGGSVPVPPALSASACGQPVQSSTWVGGSEAGSDIATSSGPFTTGIQVPQGGGSSAEFTVSQPLRIRIEAVAVGGGDPVLEIFSSSGQSVSFNDDGGDGLSSLTEVDLAPGSYCAVVDDFGSRAIAADIRVGRLEHPSLATGATPMPGLQIDPGFGGGVCSASTPATELTVGSLNSSIATGPFSTTASAAEAPFYRFTLDAPTGLLITATNQTADPLVRVYDNQGQLVAENDDADGLNSRIEILEPLAAGTYCIGMTALSDTDAPITLSVDEFTQQDMLNARYDSGQAAPPLDGSYEVIDGGVLQTTLRRDVIMSGGNVEWIVFEVPEPSLVLINAIGSGEETDTTLILYDAFGREVDQNDDYGGSFDSQTSTLVFPGQYLVAVGQYGGATNTGFATVTIQRFVNVQ